MTGGRNHRRQLRQDMAGADPALTHAVMLAAVDLMRHRLTIAVILAGCEAQKHERGADQVACLVAELARQTGRIDPAAVDPAAADQEPAG